jgi:streptogramin lyase
MFLFSLRSRLRRPRGQRQADHHRPSLEILEDRCLLSGLINEFPVPLPQSGPPSYPNNLSGLLRIAAGPDGNLWFTEYLVGKIGRLTPSGTLTEYPLPFPNSQPESIVAGPDGNLWFTESAATPDPTSPAGVYNHIGRITPNGIITEFPVPTVFSEPAEITVGTDGNLWFTESVGNRIGRITLAGGVAEFPVPTTNSFPFGIAAGPDGDLWFTEYAGNKIGRISLNGNITEFSVPRGNAQLYTITAGPDGNLWFTELDGSRPVARITSAGVITEFAVGPQPNVPNVIIVGPDGNLWFTGIGANAIFTLTTAGVSAASYGIPTGESGPAGITVGPDGNVWFTEFYGNNIGQVVIQVPTAITIGAPTVTYGADGMVTVVVTTTTTSATPTGAVSLTVDGTSFSGNLNDGVANFDVGVLRVGGHSLTASYATQGNFTASSATGTLTVNPAQLDVTANSMTKTYGQAAAFAGTEFTTSGLVNGDTVTGVTLASAGAAATAPVAGSPYAITPSAAAGTGLSNYTIAYHTGTLTVAPATLRVTANDQTKIAGEANPTFTASYSGFVLGEDASLLGGALTFSTLATVGSPPGTYAITPGGLTSDNYAITFASGTLTILSYSQATNNLLLAPVNAADLPSGIHNSLESQLQAAIDSFRLGNTTVGVHQLKAFINHISAQRGKSIRAELADMLVTAAQRIIDAAE